VKILSGGQTYVGRSLGIGPEGAVLVENSDGETNHFYAGDVHLLPVGEGGQ